MKHLITLLFLTTALPIFSSAQTIEGDAMISLLGKRVDAFTTEQFFKMYGIDKKMQKVYASSQSGIRVAAHNDTVITEINLYSNNPVFGVYKNQLSKGIKFKMSLSEVVKKLGTPNYTSPEGPIGHYRNCVYRTDLYEFVYSFTNDILDQVDYYLKKQ